MSKYRKISQTCLYIGVLMAVMAADWKWYIGYKPENMFILELPFLPAIYVVYLLIMAGCLVGAVVFSMKAKPKSIGNGTGKHAGSRLRKAGR